MIVTALVFAGLFLLTIAPGLLLCGRDQRTIGGFAAVSAASMVVCMLATALLGIMSSLLFGRSLPVAALLPVSLVLLGLAALRSRHRLGSVERPAIEWQALAATVLFLGYGITAYLMAFGRSADGSLLIHAWYNADWFKHVAHVQGLVDFGVPARDIFNSAGPLHYYWLSYVLPGAAAAFGGDAWTALFLSNLVYAALMMLTFYGLVRAVGASATVSAIAILLATVVTGRMELWPILFTPGGVQAFLDRAIAPPEPALVSLALYIPQHALALTLLLGWAVTTLAREQGRSSPASRLTLVALAAVMIVSTLFGAMLLSIYGIVELVRRRLGAIGEVVGMAVASVGLVAMLGIFKLSDPTSSVASRVAGQTAGAHPDFLHVVGRSVLALIIALGLTLLVSLYALLKLKPDTPAQQNLRLLSITLIAVPFLFLPVVAIAAGNSIAYEIFLRGLNPPAIAFGILGGWALSGGSIGSARTRLIAIAVCSMLLVLALPAAVLRHVWHGRLGDGFTTVIPADDLTVLAALKASTPRDAIVLQYPENGFLAHPPGRDVWVPVFAGRAILASARATDQSAAKAGLEVAARFFAGEQVMIPARVEAVYLSRALHPASYHALLTTMEADATWLETACRPSACLFVRQIAKGL